MPSLDNSFSKVSRVFIVTYLENIIIINEQMHKSTIKHCIRDE